jgi:hypothetical protein
MIIDEIMVVQKTVHVETRPNFKNYLYMYILIIVIYSCMYSILNLVSGYSSTKAHTTALFLQEVHALSVKICDS